MRSLVDRTRTLTKKEAPKPVDQAEIFQKALESSMSSLRSSFCSLTLATKKQKLWKIGPRTGRHGVGVGDSFIELV